MAQIEKYSINKKGRDFVIGDIHGMFSWLVVFLKKINFDEKNDRLFAVGDLVDRGPESHRVQDFLKKKWFHSVRGNHENMIIDRVYEYSYSWLSEFSNDRVHEIRNDFLKLPIMIEIETSYGKVGIVHAEVPDFIDDWNIFKKELAYNGEAVHEAMWGRTRIEDICFINEASENDINSDGFSKELQYRKFRDNVKNITYTFHGHSVIPTPIKRGNQFFIDTGAVMLFKGVFNKGAMTIVDITDKDNMEVHRYSDFGSEIYEKINMKDGFVFY